MKLSDRGARLISDFEGFRSHPYQDSAGVWTIGYGSTKGVGPNSSPISRAGALARMKREINSVYGKAVNDLGIKLNQNQFDALTSFVYNLGPGAISPKTGIGKALRQRRMQDAADEMLEWNKADGEVLPGLVRRRQAERKLFLTKPPPPPVRYTADERHLLRVIKDKAASKERHERAVLALRWRAADIQKRARKRKNGWKIADRARRYQGIRRALRRYA